MPFPQNIIYKSLVKFSLLGSQLLSDIVLTNFFGTHRSSLQVPFADNPKHIISIGGKIIQSNRRTHNNLTRQWNYRF